jgi:hypothetical protein
VHVSIGQWFAIGAFAGLAVLATRNLGAFWRGASSQERTQPDWWARGVPVAVGAGWAMLVGALLTIAAMSAHGTAQTVLAVLLAAALLVVIALAGLWLAVVLFARPRRFIPPGLRRRGSSGY